MSLKRRREVFEMGFFKELKKGFLLMVIEEFPEHRLNKEKIKRELGKGKVRWLNELG